MTHFLDNDEPPEQDGSSEMALAMFGWLAIHDRDRFDDMMLAAATRVKP